MYPLMIVGLTKKVRHVAPGRDRASFIDAAAVGTAMLAMMWVLFVGGIFETDDHTLAALVFQLGYPVMDVVLLAVAARLVVTVHLKHPPFIRGTGTTRQVVWSKPPLSGAPSPIPGSLSSTGCRALLPKSCSSSTSLKEGPGSSPRR